MNQKEIFYKEKENCKLPFSHVMDCLPDASLKVIDDLYGAATVLSMENSKKHTNILLLLSIVGTLITISFLIYDEVELHGLILACVVFVFFLFFIHKMADKGEYHRKYLEYRVLAESLRVEFFLSMAGVEKHVTDILPWFIKKSIPWVEEILMSLPDIQLNEKLPILDCWIRDQKSYHEGAIIRAKAKKKRDTNIARFAIAITLATFAFGVFFEFFVYTNYSGNLDCESVRVILKILIGTMSAITLFTGSYYGKMSLDNIINNSKRMILLYGKAEEDVLKNGETEELIIFLAREFLIENSTWYAYQSVNKPDMVI